MEKHILHHGMDSGVVLTPLTDEGAYATLPPTSSELSTLVPRTKTTSALHMPPRSLPINESLSGLARRAHSCPTKNAPKLPPFETTEFISYALFRIWHRIPPQSHPNAAAFASLCNKLHQLLCRTGVGMSCLLLSLLYITRLRQATSDSEPIALGSEYRVLVACLVLSQKWLKDDRYSNSYWSRTSQIELGELNLMERAILAKVGWKLYVGKEEFEKFRLVVKMLGGEHTRRMAALRQSALQEAATPIIHPIVNSASVPSMSLSSLSHIPLPAYPLPPGSLYKNATLAPSNSSSDPMQM